MSIMMSEQSKEESRGTNMIGAPHFASVARMHRSSNYTFLKVVCELLDNVLRKATEVKISTRIDESGKLRSLTISDNYVKGFENIYKNGAENPFNMGHTRIGQNEDDDSGMYGLGMKAGSISAGNKLNVWTKVGDECFNVELDFMKMEMETDVNKSYNPRIIKINPSVYLSEHPFEQGSSVCISEMRASIYGTTTQQEISVYLQEQIGFLYSKFIKKNQIQIEVNGSMVEACIDLFEDPKAIPFTITKKYYILEHKTKPREIVIERKHANTTWRQYNNDSHEIDAAPSDIYKSLQNKGYVCTNSISDRERASLILESTFVFYSDKYHGEIEMEKPFDQVIMELNGRIMGHLPIIKLTDGNHNYSSHRVTLTSKKIAKELGLTFNKEFHNNIENDLMIALKADIMENRVHHNSNVSQTSNHKLCVFAIDNNIIDFRTCPYAKLSNKHREKRDLIIAQEAAKASQAKKLAAASTASESDEESSDEESDEEESEEELAKKKKALEEIQAAKDAALVQALKDAAAAQALKDIETAKALKEAQEKAARDKAFYDENKTCSITYGLAVLKDWYISKKNDAKLDKAIHSIILAYQTQCNKDQLEDLLIHMNVDAKYKTIMHIMNKINVDGVDNNIQPLLGGSDLYV